MNRYDLKLINLPGNVIEEVSIVAEVLTVTNQAYVFSNYNQDQHRQTVASYPINFTIISRVLDLSKPPSDVNVSTIET